MYDLSLRSRGHLCYPRYNPTITGECCPRANPGPRVTNHRGPWGPPYPTRDSLQSRTKQDLTSFYLSSSRFPFHPPFCLSSNPFLSLLFSLSLSLPFLFSIFLYLSPFHWILFSFHFSLFFLSTATPRTSIGNVLTFLRPPRRRCKEKEQGREKRCPEFA